MPKYAFKAMALRVKGLDPQECGNELARLESQGPVTPERVVKSAKPKSSPLHDAFTWDDSEAAHKWRLEEASYLVRAVVVVDEDDGQPPVRAFVNVHQEDESEQDSTRKGVYVSTERALTTPSYREQVLASALRDLAAFRNRYRELKELARVFTAADAVLKDHAA